MIYGYLRVSSDEQDVNSQKQGVEQFAQEHSWQIDQFITDEGVSGGKDPDKRNLGPLLNQLKQGDIVICSEISRLGRDLYMVMDILHFCMAQGCIIYTVKDRFVLGEDIQSKVLAFAFGLSAEIERQMIRQRTKEGLKLRMKLGVLVGRPYSQDIEAPDYSPNSSVSKKMEENKERIVEQKNWGVPYRRLAKNFGVDHNTMWRYLVLWGVTSDDQDVNEKRKMKLVERENKEKERKRSVYQSYKDTPPQIVELDRDHLLGLIRSNLTIPEIAKLYPEFTYEQIYDTILCDREYNTEYRLHGQKRVKKGKK